MVDQTLMDQAAMKMVRRGVDAIVAPGTVATLAVRRATASTPIIMVTVSDPIERAFADSLVHPGGQATGLTTSRAGMATRRLELLLDLVPNPEPFVVVFNPADAISRRDWQEVQAAARARGLRVEPIETPDQEAFLHDRLANDLDVLQPATLLVLGEDTLIDLGANRTVILQYTLERRIPGMYFFRKWAVEGGLMAYGPSEEDLYRRAAMYVDKILRGASPADLPIGQPTAMEFVVNETTMRKDGIVLPPQLATQVTQTVH
jgi:putative ABC transport system substrate-binding protein